MLTKADAQNSDRDTWLKFGLAWRTSKADSTSSPVQFELTMSPAFACLGLLRDATAAIEAGEVIVRDATTGREQVRFRADTGELTAWAVSRQSSSAEDIQIGQSTFDAVAQQVDAAWRELPTEATTASLVEPLLVHPLLRSLLEDKTSGAGNQTGFARTALLARLGERLLLSPEILNWWKQSRADDRDPDFPYAHGAAARQSITSCANCHAQPSCRSCHIGAGARKEIARLPRGDRGGAAGIILRPRLHDLPWRESALAPATIRAAAAVPIDTTRRPLASREVRVHPAGFADAHGTAAASGQLTCEGCHAKKFCADCHDGEGRRRFHAPNFVLRHAADSYTRQRDCSTCHNPEVFCKSCHQFEPNGFALNGKLLQATYDEWKASQFARQGVQCQDCHMPDRRHRWRGIHDPDMVRSGLIITADAGAERYRPGEIALVSLRVTSARVGHAFPTYVTPRVLLSAELIDGTGQVVAGSRQEQIIGREVALDLSRDLLLPRHRACGRRGDGVAVPAQCPVWRHQRHAASNRPAGHPLYCQPGTIQTDLDPDPHVGAGQCAGDLSRDAPGCAAPSL